MTVPNVTPLLLLSELRAAFTGDTTKTDVQGKGRTAILKASASVQAWARRRFDEYVDTRHYTARLASRGGDLEDAFTLNLNDDLRTLTALAYNVDRFNNPNGVAITSGYVLSSPNAAQGVIAYDQVELDPYGAVDFFPLTVHARNSIKVTGTWGYGGTWPDTGASLGAAITSTTATTLTASDGTRLEVGMVLKIDSEYLYVDGISTNTITIGRGFNGSTAATHLISAPISRFLPLDGVQQWVKRLALYRLEQDQTPLAGAAVIGDFSVPVSTDGIPKDILADLELSGLKRLLIPVGV